MSKPSVLWFSAHEMSPEQESALGDVGQIDQINRTIKSAYELQDEINSHDIIAIVAPVNLQQQFLNIAGDKPVIMAKSDRILTKDENGREDKATFKFNKWEQVKNISVEMADFQPEDNKKVLWVSRHEMSPSQETALGDGIEVTQISKTLSNAYELQDQVKEADVVAIVAPVNLQQQFLKIAGDKPVIMAKSNRNPETGEFVFEKWEQIKSINIEMADFQPVPEEKLYTFDDMRNDEKAQAAYHLFADGDWGSASYQEWGEACGGFECGYVAAMDRMAKERVAQLSMLNERIDPMIEKLQKISDAYTALLEENKTLQKECDRLAEKANSFDLMNYAIENHPDNDIAENFSKTAKEMIEWAQEHSQDKGEHEEDISDDKRDVGDAYGD